MTLRAIVFIVGVPGVYYLDSAAFDHYTALLALPAGIILLASGPVICGMLGGPTVAGAAATCSARWPSRSPWSRYR